MRNLKKVLALVLAMAMSLSLAVTAGAAFNDQDKIVNDEAVDMCVALNIINGRTNGDFDPAGNVTRAEAAKMICIALNGGKEPTLSASATSAFADINGHWAAKYIEYCVSLGIVAGKSATTFDPNGSVTGTELAKMLLIAVGYNAEHAKFIGANWDTNVNVVASQKDLYEDLESIDPAAALSRDNAAQMIWNALNANLVEYEYTLVSDNGTLTSQVVVKDVKPAETLLGEKYGTTDTVGIMKDFTYDDDKAEWTYTVGSKSFTTDVDFTDLYQQNVKVIYTLDKNNKVDTLYGMFAYDSEVIVEGVLGDIDFTTYVADIAEYVVTINDVEYDLTKAYAMFYAFGAADKDASYTTVANTNYASAYSMKAIDNSGDGKIDSIVYVPFTVAEVSYVGAKSFTAGGNTYKFEDVNVYDGVAKNDWVMITNRANTVDDVTAFEKLEEVSATAQATKAGKIQFNDTWYNTVITSGYSPAQTAKAGDDCDFVAVNGYLYNLEATSDLAGADDLLVVTASAAATSGIDRTVSVKVLKADGSETPVEVAKVDGRAVAGAVGEGIYSFEINDDGYYELKTSGSFSTATLDYDEVVVGSANISFTAKSGDTDAYITANGTKYIADDAVVFVKDSAGDFSVTTGEKLKATKTGMTVAIIGADKDDATGYNMVKLAYVVSDTLGAATGNYAYVTGDAVVIPDGEKFYVEIPVGDETLTTKTVADNTAVLNAARALQAGDVISYTLNAEGDVDSIDVKYTMTTLAATSGAANFTAAVTAYNGNNIQFSSNYFTSKTAATGTSVTYEATLADDVEIIYVDNAENTIEEGSVQLALDTVITAVDANAHYYANVKVVTNSSSEVVLMIVDINNDILNVQ